MNNDIVQLLGDNAAYLLDQPSAVVDRRTVVRLPMATKDVASYLGTTPETLSRRLGTNVYIKYELFQKTGSFKPRGAFNTILSLTESEKAKGEQLKRVGMFTRLCEGQRWRPFRLLVCNS